MFQSPGSIVFSVLGLSVHWYGLLIAAGVLLAFFVAQQEMQRRNLNPDFLYDMGFWLILAGILGARFYYVIFQWEYYAAHPADILAVWKGGLAIHGALLGGFLAFFIFMRKKKTSWLMYADILMPGVLLAQAVGRWGNFFNNEAFGSPTDKPWKLFIPESFRPEGFESSAFYHPTFLYESLWNFLGFLILFYLTRKWYPDGRKKHPGMIFFAYLVFYSVGRFFIEGFRLDSLFIGSFRTAQAMSLVLFFAGLYGFFWVKRKSLKPKK